MCWLVICIPFRPQVTIASAMMVCHRFYMRQSHAKNDWQVSWWFKICFLKSNPMVGLLILKSQCNSLKFRLKRKKLNHHKEQLDNSYKLINHNNFTKVFQLGRKGRKILSLRSSHIVFDDVSFLLQCLPSLKIISLLFCLKNPQRL